MRWVKTDKIPYKNSKDEIVGIIGFTVDITEIKKAEEELRVRSEEVERMNNLMIDRELKMVQLKNEIESLKK